MLQHLNLLATSVRGKGERGQKNLCLVKWYEFLRGRNRKWADGDTKKLKRKEKEKYSAELL